MDSSSLSESGKVGAWGCQVGQHNARPSSLEPESVPPFAERQPTRRWTRIVRPRTIRRQPAVVVGSRLSPTALQGVAGSCLCPASRVPHPDAAMPAPQVLAEYIWLGSGGADLCSRTVVLEQAPAGLEALPVAEIDGSSCGQAMDEHCEVYLKPRKIFPDPMRGGPHILVLCDTFVPPLVSCERRLTLEGGASCPAVVLGNVKWPVGMLMLLSVPVDAQSTRMQRYESSWAKHAASLNHHGQSMQLH